jgi:hypothetical protein
VFDVTNKPAEYGRSASVDLSIGEVSDVFTLVGFIFPPHGALAAGM